MQTVSYDDWKAIIRLVTGCSDPTENSEIDRCKVFDAVQAVFRGAVNGQECASDQNFRKLNKSTPEVASLVKEVPNVDSFLTGLRSKHLQSLGVHIVDPIAGRPSAIWRNLDEPLQILLTRTELYVCVWNQLYRRLFRPNASLINAIESGVLPWRWTDLFLRTVPRTSSHEEAWYSDPFFEDTRKIAREFHETIEKFYPIDPVPGDTQQLTTMVQSVTNELIRSGFQTRLDRIALRFRDQIIDDTRKKESLYEYLKVCFGETKPDFLQTLSADNTEDWGLLSDIIQAIQSSILSQPAFCDESGLWLYRIKFVKSPSSSQTNIFFVFGLCNSAKQNHKNGFYSIAKRSFDNLQRALEEIVADPSAKDSDTSDSEIVTDLVDRIRNNRPDIRYHDKGLIRWLTTVAKIMAGAKHEGHAISYKIGYGSLA